MFFGYFEVCYYNYS